MIDILSLTASLRDIQINLGTKQCLRRYKTSSCQACLDGCPKNALNTANGKVELNLKKCSSCGLCLNVCPTECFKTKPDFSNTLLQKIKQGFPQILSCSKSKQKDSIKLNCLGALNEALIFSSALKSNNLFIITDACNNCDIAPTALPIIKQKIKIASDLVSLVNKQAKIEMADKPLKLEVNINRKQFIKSAANEFFKLSVSALPKIEEDTFLPQNRRLLLKPFEEKIIKAEINENLPFYELKIEKDSCDLCLNCIKFCPTKSITTETKKAKTTLKFNMSRCIDCNLCQELCPKNCLTIENAKSLTKLFKWQTIVAFNTSRCKRCNMTIVKNEDEALCSVCRKKQNLDESFSKLFEAQV